MDENKFDLDYVAVSLGDAMRISEVTKFQSPTFMEIRVEM